MIKRTVSILATLLLLCMLAGCKIELPAKATAATASFAAVSSQADFQANEASSGQSSAGASIAGSAANPGSPAKSTASRPVSSSRIGDSSKAPAISSQAPSSKASSPPATPAQLTCTLSITCSDILTHKDRFSAAKLSIVPAGGIILAQQEFQYRSGESVYAMLLRITKEKNIPFAHSNSPILGTEYVQQIGNIAEKGYGTASGWTYTVNGKQTALACNDYKIQQHDNIQWTFFCGK